MASLEVAAADAAALEAEAEPAVAIRRDGPEDVRVVAQVRAVEQVAGAGADLEAAGSVLDVDAEHLLIGELAKGGDASPVLRGRGCRECGGNRQRDDRAPRHAPPPQRSRARGWRPCGRAECPRVTAAPRRTRR